MTTAPLPLVPIFLEYTCRCDWNKTEYFDVLSMYARPICSDCDAPFLVRVDVLLNRSDMTATNVMYDQATLLDAQSNCLPLPKSEIIPERVHKYAELMRTYRWKPSPFGQGGYLCPLVFINKQLLLGAQRIEAAIEANFYPLFAATIHINVP